MARRGFGPMGYSPIPTALAPYFTVAGMMTRLHGRSRKPAKPKQPHHHALHGRTRSTATHNADPWKHKGIPSGRH